MFILAATGSAVGLGNIWKFPYIAGENGGGAFVLVYLICVALIGLPIMMCEVLLGREGRQSPINTMGALAARSSRSRHWTLLAWLGAMAGFLILSYYGVIAGWAMAYIFKVGSGALAGVEAGTAEGLFNAFTGNVWEVLFWQVVFMLLTIFIVARGVGQGLEMAVRYLMPALFVLLIVLVGYATTTGHFGQGLSFLFDFNFEKMSWNAVLVAMGHAFFTLSLGMATMMAYGSYMPRGASIMGTVATIAVLDTVVALVAGMAIFPVVFANGLESAAGPGLMFITLPLAFGKMGAGGQFFGTIFFILVTFAAITSAISLVEPAAAWVVEKFKISRAKAAIYIGCIAWFIGLGTVFSTNIWESLYFLGDRNFFDSVDYLTAQFMLPLGGMLTALFAGWFVDRQIPRDQMSETHPLLFKAWLYLARFIAPVAVFIVFVMSLY
jgi:NSS family neurotransmitter:Na+ symporter